MKIQDLNDVIRIANMSFPFTGRRPSVIGPYVIDRLYNDPNFQFVALIGGRIVGFITCKRQNKKDAELTYIAVHPNYRGIGIGRKLVHALENKLKSYKYERVWLVTQPMAKNFYIRLGYRVFRITYRLGYELLDKNIEIPNNVNFKNATLNEILSFIKFIKNWNIPLTYFIKVYEKEPDKALIVSRNDNEIGFIIAETDEYNRDLLIIRYFWSRNDTVDDFLTLINSIMYIASLKGYRWLGISLSNNTLVNELKKREWIENPLPTFMNIIYMEKYFIRNNSTENNYSKS